MVSRFDRHQLRHRLWIKALAVSLFVGLVAAAVVDVQQGIHLRHNLEREMQRRLTSASTEARQRFDRYLRMFQESATLLAGHWLLAPHLRHDIREMHAHGGDAPEIYSARPHWLPAGLGWLDAIRPEFVLTLDDTGQVVELASLGRADPPAGLITLDPALLELALGQPFITRLDGHPILLSAAPVESRQGKVGYLLLGSLLDDELLRVAQRVAGAEDAAVLLTMGDPPRVLASNLPTEVDAGTSLARLQGKYLLSAKSFFDYGAAEVPLGFYTALPRSVFHRLAQRVRTEQRWQLGGVILLLVALFTLIMQLYARRTALLAARVEAFSSSLHDGTKTGVTYEDEVDLIEGRFHELVDAVARSQRRLGREKQLDGLSRLADTAGLGLLLCREEGVSPFSPVTEQLCSNCGGYAPFLAHTEADVPLRLLDREGRQRAFLVRRMPLEGGETVILIQDITELDETHRRLERHALYDDLTGLPNRLLLLDRARQLEVARRREDRPFALALLDLDDFKAVNDTLGHFAGDALLRQVAQRMQQALRGTDTLARLGGDEFALLLPDTGLEDAEAVCTKLAGRLDKSFEVEGHRFRIGVSIGIAGCPDHGDQVTLLLQRADVAMYHAKQQGARIERYDESIDPYTPRRLALAQHLDAFADGKGLEVWFQPQLCMVCGEPPAVEALARWWHPTLGLLNPGDFIGLVESTGLIHRLTFSVLDQTLRRTASWLRTGRISSVSVNLSARNLADPSLVDRIQRLLEIHGVKPDQLVVEITESALMADPEGGRRQLGALAELGVETAIDDFGTGYSSLAYLSHLPVHELKIDRTFVQEIEASRQNQAIVKTIIDLARHLGLRVVAEGVETDAQAEMLRAFGCDRLQGFLFARPLAPEVFNQWLDDWQPPSDCSADANA